MNELRVDVTLDGNRLFSAGGEYNLEDRREQSSDFDRLQEILGDRARHLWGHFTEMYEFTGASLDELSDRIDAAIENIETIDNTVAWIPFGLPNWSDGEWRGCIVVVTGADPDTGLPYEMDEESEVRAALEWGPEFDEDGVEATSLAVDEEFEPCGYPYCPECYTCGDPSCLECYSDGDVECAQCGFENPDYVDYCVACGDSLYL